MYLNNCIIITTFNYGTENEFVILSSYYVDTSTFNVPIIFTRTFTAKYSTD